MTGIEEFEKSRELLRKQRRKQLTFWIPITIQSVLAIVHFIHGFAGPRYLPEGAYTAFWVATYLYTLLLFLFGVLNAISMTMEGISAKIKKEHDTEHQWMRDDFKIARRYLPAYNASFASSSKKTAGAVVSAIYIFALIMNWFVGSGIITFVSVCMVWFGMWSVAKCNRLIEEARVLHAARAAKKAQSAAEILADLPEAYVQETPRRISLEAE